MRSVAYMSGKRKSRMSLPTSFGSGALFILFFLFLSAALGLPASDTAGDNPSIPLSMEELTLKIDSLMREASIPGVAVALVSRDSIMWMKCLGFANVETGEPLTEDTHFRVGSCTKSFVGLGFLKLVEEGRIDLNIPVEEIAPEVRIDNPWRDTHPVRVVHLLEHTAGFDDSHLNWFYFKGPVMPLERALEIKARLRKVRWQPGTRCSYSSPGYTLAGYLLGKVSGERYEDYLKRVVLEPIGMKTTTIGRTDERKERLAVGYGRDMEPVPCWYDYDEPAGAMNSSLREMALFVQFMLNKGRKGTEQIVNDELFDRAGRPSTGIAAQAGLGIGYSFGISSGFQDGLKWYGHGGIVPGFFADYHYSPECGRGYVVLVNQFAFVIYDEIMDWARRCLGCEADTTRLPSAVQVPEERLKSYCGYYEARNPRMQHLGFLDILVGGTNIMLEKDTLFQKDFMSDKTALVPVSWNMFRKSSDPEASRIFTENADGRMVYATSSSYYERVASWKPVMYRALVFGALVIMISAIIYALFWIPVHLYKILRKRDDRSKYLRLRIVPLLAVLSLVMACVAVSDQTMLEFGQMTVRNIAFYALTLVFAGLSVLSLIISYVGMRKPVKKIALIYGCILSLACFAMMLYLGSWEIIGLKLWAY